MVRILFNLKTSPFVNIFRWQYDREGKVDRRKVWIYLKRSVEGMEEWIADRLHMHELALLVVHDSILSRLIGEFFSFSFTMSASLQSNTSTLAVYELSWTSPCSIAHPKEFRVRNELLRRCTTGIFTTLLKMGVLWEKKSLTILGQFSVAVRNWFVRCSL